MSGRWTFGKKVGVGFGVTVLLAVLASGIGIYALLAVVDAKDGVIRTEAQTLIDAQRLQTSVEARVAAVRGYLLGRDGRFLESYRAAGRDFESVSSTLRRRAGSGEEGNHLERIEAAYARHSSAVDRVIAARRSSDDLERAAALFDEEAVPARDELSRRIEDFLELERRRLETARQSATDLASTATSLVATVSALAVLMAVLIAVFLTRALARQIGGAVSHVQSSSAELSAAASQQATASKEQATAMREIATTITELLATSRQIAESAKRVSNIASETAAGANAGESTVERSTESIAAIRRQVDAIVAHMLELGRKSQQIGAVVDIVSELAEQTNILAINATIEATGAGEAGRRFGVVADEIRKLADRVAGSAKEIRVLIDDVRGAVNTTVMATETGSKAVDAGAKQVADVASSFRRIVDLVGTTTEASREIELSTKQQTSAVEQVNSAIANVAQATRETEASASQTLQTAQELTSLSRELSRLVQPEDARVA